MDHSGGGSSFVGEGFVDDAAGRRVQPGICNRAEPVRELGVEIVHVAGLSTLLSIGSQAGSSGQENDLARALRQGASDGVSQVGRQVVGRQLDIAPTLTIPPGFPVRVLVTRDLVLEPYGG